MMGKLFGRDRIRLAQPSGAPRRGRLAVSLVIAALLLGSGVARLAGGTGAAIAREVSQIGAGRPVPLDALSPAACVTGDTMESLLSDLAAQRQKLSGRDAEMDLRESDLVASAQLIEAQLAELETAEAELRDLIALAATAAEGDIAQLTMVYENMKPKEAAAVFEQMAPEFAAGFLGRMRPESAARILAGLRPTTAYGVSAILAGRNARVPTE